MTAARDPRRGAAVRTFLIGDIRGYTRFTGQHGDEAASRLAAAFAEIAQEAVEAWDGELVELRGDEVLAVFDSARQALRCAIELQDALADETRTRPELPLTVGIGLDAGEAVPVGDGYRGAALNMAARLCASAAGGEVIASADLVHLAGPMPGLAFEALPPKELKGIEGPVDAMRVASTVGQAGAHALSDADVVEPLPAELQPIVPLAGREVELRWLRWHWRRARHGHGRTVVVSGQPGIGKTRLAAELATVVHADGASVRYLPSGKGADAEDLLAGHALTPTLLVVDDFDAAPSPLPRAVVAVAGRATETPTLLLLTHREEAAASLTRLVEPLASAERRRTLGPLGADAVRSIATLYAGRAAEALPIRDVLDESGGVPAAVHRVAAAWARGSATLRLGASADRTETGRRSLRDAEDELIGDVAELELVRERSRRLALDVPSDGVPASAASAITICPYKGLASFDGADAEYFFGRERLVAELVARVVGSPFLGLIGASGSGKSSALRAGLLPSLAAGVLPGSDRWRQVVMRPADHPVTELGRALRRAFPDAPFAVEPSPGDLDTALGSLAPDQQLLLAIDQFEEVFTATRDDAERSAFLELLTANRPGLRVVATMRADHYGDAAPYPALARLLSGSQVLVGPLTGSELAAVIEAPAERVGLRVEPELTRQLVEDAGAEPGVLPLLSTSLLELWQARQAGWLTLEAYRAGGGLKGAVARLAETALAELDPAQTGIARSIFLRLAGPGEGEGVVRQRVPLAELDADRDPAVGRVLDALVAARLLTTGDGYVEVAHEALLREWPRLQGWLEEDAAGRRLRLHLVGAVRDWEQRGREPADLYRGARLSAALDWASEHQADLNTAEREFLEESRAASQRAVEHERTINRRLRGLLAGAGALLLVAVAAGGVAFLQADTARQQADNAAAQRTLAEQRAAEAQAATVQAEQSATEAKQNATAARGAELAAAAVSTLKKDPALSKLLAVSAGTLVPDDAAIEISLHRAALADAIVHRWTWPYADRSGEGLTADLDPDGRLMVVSNVWASASDIAVIDVATDKEVWAVRNDLPELYFGQALFTPDGTRVISSLRWNPDPEKDPAPAPKDAALGVLIWDAKTGQLIRRIDTGPCGTELLGVSDTTAILQPPAADDGGPACTGEFIKRLAELDLATGRQRDLTPELSRDWAMSRDGRFVVYQERAKNRLVVLDVGSRKPVFTADAASFPQDDNLVRAISDDGKRLVFGDRPMLLIDVESGLTIAPLHVGGESFGGVVFARNSHEVFSVGRDAVLRRWDGDDGRLLFAAPAAGGGRPSVSNDGHVLVADEVTKSVVLVDPTARGELGTVRFCGNFVPGGSLVVREDTIAVNSSKCGGRLKAGPTTLASAETLEVVASLPNAFGQVLGVSPDGKMVVRQTFDEPWVTPASLWDGATGTQLRDLEGLCRWDASVDKPAFETNPTCHEYPEPPFPMFLNGVAWTPDSRLVALVDGNDGWVAVWDAGTGRLMHAFDIESGVRSASFSPDGRRLIASGYDGSLMAFETTTWTQVARSDPGSYMLLAGFLADGRTLIGMSTLNASGGSLLRIDGETLEVLGSTRAHDGSPKAIALSPDHRQVVTGAGDGIVRVWDGATGDLLHQVEVDGQAQGVAFLDDKRIAVAPQGGNVLVFDLDRQDLLDTVSRSLTRGFTPEECQQFGFDPCPTLEQLRGD